MITWEHLQMFITACGSFTVVCVAVGWVIKIAHGVRKPVTDIDAKIDENKADADEKLQRDYDRINQHDKDMQELRADLDYLKEALKLLLENDKTMLEHMRTNNATGDIAAREKATFNFLNAHQK